MRGGTFDFAGLGGPALILVIALSIVGIVAAIRGYWGSSRKARRVTVVAAILAPALAFLLGAFLLIDGYHLLARLGPAATPTDEGYVWRRALSPAIAGVAALSLITLVAGIGWIRERGAGGEEPPPRKPAR
jgi:hypothetical protein